MYIEDVIESTNRIHLETQKFKLCYESIYNTTRYDKGRLINFSTVWKKHDISNTRVIICLNECDGYIGFWDNCDPGNERFYPLIHVCTHNGVLCITEATHFFSRSFRMSKKRMMLALAKEVKKIIEQGCSIIFPDVHPNIRPDIKKMFLVEKDGRKYTVENFSQVKIPFSVLEESFHFIEPNYKYVEPSIDPNLFISLIKKRYKYVEKIIEKMV